MSYRFLINCIVLIIFSSANNISEMINYATTNDKFTEISTTIINNVTGLRHLQLKKQTNMYLNVKAKR